MKTQYRANQGRKGRRLGTDVIKIRMLGRGGFAYVRKPKPSAESNDGGAFSPIPTREGPVLRSTTKKEMKERKIVERIVELSRKKKLQVPGPSCQWMCKKVKSPRGLAPGHWVVEAVQTPHRSGNTNAEDEHSGSAK